MVQNPNAPGETDSNGGGGGGGYGAGIRQDNEEADEDRARRSTVAENQEHSGDRPVPAASLTDEAEEALALGASDAGAGGSSSGAPPCEEMEPLPLGMDDLPGACVDAALQGGPPGIEDEARSDFEHDTPPAATEATDGGCGIPVRVRVSALSWPLPKINCRPIYAGTGVAVFLLFSFSVSLTFLDLGKYLQIACAPH